MRRERVRNN
jgi:hypothetical protein